MSMKISYETVKTAAGLGIPVCVCVCEPTH